jgi:hypothetical protein
VAEWIKASDPSLSAGDVVVIDSSKEKQIKKSSDPYCTLAAGVISTKPGILLGYDEDNNANSPNPTDQEMAERGFRKLALAGRVLCNVSAENGAIEIGDLLTTSLTPGYAMKATDKLRAIGAIVGKALEPLKDGKGKIEVLVTLQ